MDILAYNSHYNNGTCKQDVNVMYIDNEIVNQDAQVMYIYNETCKPGCPGKVPL
jgi:hypothetical protein